MDTPEDFPTPSAPHRRCRCQTWHGVRQIASAGTGASRWNINEVGGGSPHQPRRGHGPRADGQPRRVVLEPVQEWRVPRLLRRGRRLLQQYRDERPVYIKDSYAADAVNPAAALPEPALSGARRRARARSAHYQRHRQHLQQQQLHAA